MGGVILFSAVSCNREEAIDESTKTFPSNAATINRMVQITNEHTAQVKNEIAVLVSRNTKMSTEQYDGFVRSTLTQYVTKLVESEPEHLVNNGGVETLKIKQS